MAMTLPVVIGFADALAAIETAWCLRDDGFEVIAFAREGTRPALARSPGVRVVEIRRPEHDASASVADLAAVIREVRPAVVLPLDDHAVWLCDRANAEFDSPGRFVLAGPVGPMASLALDKRQQVHAAREAGLCVLPTVDASSGDAPGNGPWMVKPALAVELRKGRLVRPTGRSAATPSQIRELVAVIGGPALAQPLTEGVGEGVFGLPTPSGVVAWSAHRRVRMMNPRGSGSSACRSIELAEELKAPVSSFIASTGWQGLFMMEFLRDAAGTPWFMELNGRAWGSMALARRRGYAYPAWAVRQALDAGFTPVEPVDPPHLTARHLGREIVHLGAVLSRGGAPRLATMRNVVMPRRGDSWYNWRRGEARVFAADSLATIRDQVKVRRRSQ
jgi:hypothetical protein